MSTANEAIVLAYLDLSWNTGKFHLIKDFLDPNFYYKTTFADDILNLEQYIAYIRTFRAAMPELSLQVEDVMSRDERVMTSISFSGTIEKSIFGIPPSDKIITFPAVSLWTVTNGKIVSLNTLIDISGIERQVKIPLNSGTPLDNRLK
jgi:steroid delta-isomerase-like uncharacterized protein